MATTIRTRPEAEVINSGLAARAKKLGAAKGRAHQEATRKAREAKASQRALAVEQIKREIVWVEARIERLRPFVDCAWSDWKAKVASARIRLLESERQDLLDELQAFL